MRDTRHSRLSGFPCRLSARRCFCRKRRRSPSACPPRRRGVRRHDAGGRGGKAIDVTNLNGGGITLKNYGVVLGDGMHDAIIRHLRVRPGFGGSGQPDGIGLYGGDNGPVRNVIIDPCSISWAIDAKIGERVFLEDLLSTFRESIRSHRRLTWVFAGSHEVAELIYAPWTSYLVSVWMIEVPVFTEAESTIRMPVPPFVRGGI